MVPSRRQTVELAIELVRNGGKRVPVSSVTMGKSPSDPRKTQPLLDDVVFVDVGGIIIVDKLVTERLPENNPGESGHQNANRDSRDHGPRPASNSFPFGHGAI